MLEQQAAKWKKAVMPATVRLSVFLSGIVSVCVVFILLLIALRFFIGVFPAPIRAFYQEVPASCGVMTDVSCKKFVDVSAYEGIVANINSIFETSNWSIFGMYIVLGFFIKDVGLRKSMSCVYNMAILMCLLLSTISCIFCSMMYRVNLGRQFDFAKVDLEMMDTLMDAHMSSLLSIVSSLICLLVSFNLKPNSRER
jgi:hypothetical protein